MSMTGPGTSGQDDPLRVIIADDDPLVRRVVREILQHAGITVVAEASDGRDAVSLTRHYGPDLLLLDVVMPGLDGLAALTEIISDPAIATKVVMLSVRGEHDVAFLALRRGAFGYLSKDLDLAVLPRVLADVAAGRAAVSRDLTTHLVRRLRELPAGGVGMRPVQSSLTAREWEVADLLCMRKRTEEIAEALVLTTETVRTHVKNIMRKLDVHTRGELVDVVEQLRSGLISTDDAGLVRSAA